MLKAHIFRSTARRFRSCRSRNGSQLRQDSAKRRLPNPAQVKPSALNAKQVKPTQLNANAKDGWPSPAITAIMAQRGDRAQDPPGLEGHHPSRYARPKRAKLIRGRGLITCPRRDVDIARLPPLLTQ